MKSCILMLALMDAIMCASCDSMIEKSIYMLLAWLCILAALNFRIWQ